ncbi:Tyrosine recombinase XerD [Halioglobus japonicus]|nr:Tyrosine recombinase XerD [Halioglobus japonicus]
MSASFDQKNIRDRLAVRSMEQRELSFSDLIRLYCLDKKPNHSRDCRLKKWHHAYGDLCAWDVTPEQCNALLDLLQEDRYANATINREQTDIQAIFNWAIRYRRRTGCPKGFINPLADRPKLPEDLRVVQLSDAKIDQLLLEARASHYPRMYGLVLLALTSGARKNEIRRMRWSNTYLEEGTAEIGIDGKSGSYRTIMLSPQVVTELRNYKQHDPDALVFPRRWEPFAPFDERVAWKKITTAIGRPDLHFHDLRHLATARLLRSGASLHVTSRVLGHKDARMVSRRYGSLEKQDLLNAVVTASEGL